MLTLTITWAPGAAAANIARMSALLTNPEERHATIETAVETAVREHIERNYSPRINSLGAPSTGYWKGVADSTTALSGADGVQITIRQRGLRLKYHGGVITGGQSGRTSEATGKPVRFLTIPVHPAAHGHTIADLGGRSAFYIVPFGAGGGLSEGGDSAGAGVFRKTGPKRSDSDPLFYILKRSVRIKADPNILPPAGAILNGCMRALQDALQGQPPGT